METLCELLHGDNLNKVYVEDNLCLSCTNAILRSNEFLSCQKLEVLQIMNEQLEQSVYFEEILRDDWEIFFETVDSLGYCLLHIDMTILTETNFANTDMLFESICICLNNILCKIHRILGRKQTEDCLDLLLARIEPQQNNQNHSTGVDFSSHKIIFFLLFLMKKDEEKETTLYDIVASNVLRNNEFVSFIVNLICHSNVPNVRLVAATLIMQCLQIVCSKEGQAMVSVNYVVNTRRFGNLSPNDLSPDFENILGVEPDLTNPTLQEYLIRVVAYLIVCGYPNFQTMIDKVILFLQMRCLFPDVRVRALVVDTLRMLLEKDDWVGIARYVFITGMPEYLLESIKTAFQQIKLETDDDLEYTASCFEGIFYIMQKLLKLEEARETQSSFVFQSIIQGMVSFLKYIKGNKRFESSQQTYQLLLSFFRLSHTFFEDVACTSETDSVRSMRSQGFMSLKFFEHFLDFSGNEILEEEMASLVVEMTRNRACFLEEQLELLVQMNTRFKSRECILSVAYSVLFNVIQSTDEERPKDYIDIFHRTLTPHLVEYSVENMEQRQIETFIVYSRIVNEFLVPTFWKEQTTDKLIHLAKTIWKSFHPVRLFSFFQIYANDENKIQISQHFRVFIARLLHVLDSEMKLEDAIVFSPLSDMDICNSFQQISTATFVSLRLLLLDYAIRSEWALDWTKLYYCMESISNMLPQAETTEHIRLAELVSQVWVLLCRDKACTDFETKSRSLRCPKQLQIPATFVSFLFQHFTKSMGRNIDSIKLLLENCQIDMEVCQHLQTRLVSLQNEQPEEAQVSIQETTNYFNIVVELTSSFDCYGQLLLHDISRFIQWLRFPLDIVDSYALKRTLQFWCNALLHFTQDSETQRIVFRLLKMGLFSKVNDVLHATADYYQKGHHEREQLQLLLQINKLFVYLLDCFNRWVDLETSSVGYLEDVNSLLQSLLTAVDSFATFSHETLRENLNCLHILVIFLDRIATAEGTRVTCSTSNWLVRNIISKKTWFQSAMKEYFELLLNRQEDYLFETGCSFHSHWESLLSLFITLIAFGPKKNQHLVDMFPKSLVYWRNAIFACYRFPSYQRPLLVVVTNLLFACIARARAYQWEWEASLAEDVDNDAILYHFCNQIFSSHTLIEISAYRAMEAWILSLRAVDEPLKRRTTVEAVKRCLGIKLVQDTPLLVWAPRLSLVACFFEIVDHDWLSESYWESMLLHVTQKRGVGPIQMECMQHMIRSLEFAPRGCLEKFLPILMQTIHDLENENTYQAKVGCPILVDDTVLTPVVYQWQQDFCIKKDIQSLFQHNK